MGSYSCADHLLPFLTEEHIAQAGEINRAVGAALLTETGEYFKGVLYGGFMLTNEGVKLIEYNVRFGDPEVMNVLSLLDTDFVEICMAIIDGTLDKLPVKFRHQASVCKYVVPVGYGTKSHLAIGTAINVDEILRSPDLNGRLRLYYAAVNERNGGIELTDSRSLAVVGLGNQSQRRKRSPSEQPRLCKARSSTVVISGLRVSFKSGSTT